MTINTTYPWARFIVCLDDAGNEFQQVVEIDTESLEGTRMEGHGRSRCRITFWAARVAFSRYTPDSTMIALKRGFPALDGLTRVGDDAHSRGTR